MENNIQRPKGRGAKILTCALLSILFIVLSGIGGISYVAWNRLNKKNEHVKAVDTDKINNSIKEFSSDVIYQPKEDIVTLVTQVSPAVVTVVSKTTVQDIFLNEEQEVEQGVGTGFFVSEDGLLITNEHVVCGANPLDLTIVTSLDKSYEVESFATDPFQDIAILKVKLNGDKITYLKFANAESKVAVGQEVLAIGNPLGVNPGSVTNGIVSGLGRNVKAQGTCNDKLTQKEYEGLIQTDAAINGGNSGGPLINMLGEVIGVNSATSVGANNISYALPSERVSRLLGRYLANDGKISFPFIGVSYSMIDSNLAKSKEVPEGAFVKQLVDDSPAAKGGMKKGDIITKINDKKVEFSLQATLNQYFEPNEKVKIEVYRPKGTSPVDEEMILDGEYINLDVVIGARSAE